MSMSVTGREKLAAAGGLLGVALTLSSIGFVWSVLCSVADENRNLRQDQIHKSDMIDRLNHELNEERSKPHMMPGSYLVVFGGETDAKYR